MRKLIAQLGDTNPFDYDGYFIFQDEIGSYEGEFVCLMNDYADAEEFVWNVYRFPLTQCTCVDGVLSDNPFHPEQPAWFSDSLHRIATHVDTIPHDIVYHLCSDNPELRLHGWTTIGDYHGWANLDEYPLTNLTREDLEERYRGYDKL